MYRMICEWLPNPFCGFVESLIKLENHSKSETHPILITSIVQDIAIAVKRGKAMPDRHSFICSSGTWPNRLYEIYSHYS